MPRNAPIFVHRLCVVLKSAKQNAVKWKFGKNKEGVARCYSFFSSVSSSSAIASVSACQRSIAAAFRS